MSEKFNGYFKLHIGPMFSRKTSTLIEDYIRHSLGQRKCMLIKHTFDNRYNEDKITTHDGKNVISTIVCNLLCEAEYLVHNYQVICIDEVQFFDDAVIFCDKWANEGLIVEAVGLSGTYQRKEFPIISQLIPLAEKISKKNAICCETGKNAPFTQRISNIEGDIIIGGYELYKPVDRQTFFANIDMKNYEIDKFKKFIDIYCEKNGCNIDDSKMKNIIDYFADNYQDNMCYLDIFKKFPISKK